ncbi:MAG: hypothetical protein WA895_41775, partial [Streptosporangiaceae bacterium]
RLERAVHRGGRLPGRHPQTRRRLTGTPRIRARRYHRDRAAISLADCVAASTALAARQPLATADPALAAALRAEGGDLHPLAARIVGSSVHGVP